MPHRLWTAAGKIGAGVALALLLVASAVLVASAASGPRDLKIACARKSDGMLRYVDRASKCHPRTERVVHLDGGTQLQACVQQSRATRLDPDGDGDIDVLGHGVVLARAHDHDVRGASAAPHLGAIWLAGARSCRRRHQRPIMVPGQHRWYFCAGHHGFLRFVSRLSGCHRRELDLILKSFALPGPGGNPGAPNGNGPNANGPPGNTPPTAHDDAASTDERHPVNVNVLANDTDPSTHPLSVASIDTTGTAGHVTTNPDNTVKYDPNGKFAALQAGQSATDSFKYRATDGHLTSNPATVTVTVTGVNDPPALAGVETTALSYTAGNPHAITSSLTASDPDDANLSGATVSISSGYHPTEDTLSFTNQNGISGSFSAASGVLTLSGSSSLANYQAALRSVQYKDSNATSPSTTQRTISFQVTDPHGAASNAATRNVTVSANSAPTANDDSTSTGKHSATDISVLANDTDADGDPLHVASVDTTGTKGSVSINGDGTIHYDPNGQFNSAQTNQTDTFKYKASDGFSDSNSATVTVTIQGSNDAPVLSGIESSSASYQAGSAATPVSSSLTVADDDDTNLSGATVSITSGYSSGEDQLGFVNQNGITGSFDSGTGVLTLSGSASLADYQTALRSVTFSNPNGASASTATRTISFQVTDPHSAASNTQSRNMSVTDNPPPTATDDSASTGKHTATDVNVLSNDSDSDGDSLSVSSIDTTGTKGSVSINGNGTIKYDPNGQFNSLQSGDSTTDTFKYKANDGFSDSGWATVTVTIQGSNDAPVLANIESTAVQYAAGTTATVVTSTLTASDDDDTNLSGATVTISSGHVATEDQLNFTNQNGITGSFDSTTGVLTLSGTASVADYQAALRSVTYADSNGTTPTTGTRTISFQASDPHSAASNTQSRNISVGPNSAPTAVNDSTSTGKHTATDISVLSNDSDSDGDALHVASVDTTGTKGSVSINSDGTIHYDPNGQFDSAQTNQTDTFTYKASDGYHDSNSATVTVTINGSNDAPVLSGIESTSASYQAGSAATPISSSLAVSDDDDTNLSGATVSITSGYSSGEDQLGFVNQNGITGSFDSSTGVLTLSGTASVADYQTALRSVTYSNPNGASASTATRTITFQATDPHSAASNTQSRDVSVTDNPPPTANDDSASTDSLTATDINVLSNDSDSDGDSLSVSSIDTTGTKGSVSINGNNTIKYDPNGQFNSLAKGTTTTDTFKYKANDGFSDSNSATVTVTITGANHPPVLANIESAAVSGYRAQDPAVNITSSLTASDSDNTNLASATVSITSGLATGDSLNFTNQNGISGSYNSTSGVLSLTGSSSVANYQTALRSVTYSNSSAATTTTSRTITFQADDGESNNHASNTQSRDISVGPANQAPSAGTDNYSAVGNTTLGVGTSPSGPAVTQSGSVLSNDSDPDSTSSLTVTPGTITSAHGSVTMNSDGTFTYLPAQGYSGSDSFNYTVTDTDDPSNPKSTTGTVNISVGTVVWYVDNSKTSAGDGRSTSPFNTLAAANAKVGSGDVMFLYQGSGNYTGGTTMQSNEQLIGQPNGLTVSGHSLVTASGSNPVITNSGGDGIDLASGTTIRRVDVSSPSGAGISGTSVSTADIGSSMSISGASGSSFKLTGGSGNVTMGASITNSAGHSVDISGRSGGTTTLSGDVSDSGTGVLLTSNTGATIGFTGKITNSTGTNQAFTAIGGGTVTATAGGSTLTSTTGRALQVDSTTIGSGGLKFQSISAGTSASGPASGIVLNATGTTAGLTVTGNGPAASGGMIQNATGDAISLTSTSSPSFNDMQIFSPQHDGVNGTSVHGFTFTNGTVYTAGSAASQQTDSAFAFNNNSPAGTNDNLDGAVTIFGNTVTNPYGSGVDILNFNGTISDANISDNYFSSTTSTTTSKGSAIALNLFGSATTVPNLTKAEIENNTIVNFPSGYGINVQGGNNTTGTAPSGTYGTPGTTNTVQISGNLANGSYTGGKCLPGNGACMGLATINANVTGRGQGNFNISSNGTAGTPLGRSIGSPFQTGAAGSVTANFAIENNIVSAYNAGGGDGIGLGVDKNQQADSTVLANPSVKATITGNQVSNYDGGGVHFIQLDSNGSSYLKMDSNKTSSPESDNQAGAGIEVDEGSSGSTSYNPSLCSEINSNTAAAGNANSFGDTVPGIVITKESTSSSTYSFGIVGLSPSPANESQTQSYLAGQNPASAAGGGFYAGTTVFANPGDQWTTCTLPTMP